MIYKMVDSRPKSKALESTLEDIDRIKEGGVLEICIMQTDGSFSRLFDHRGKYDYVVGVREKGSNQPSNGPFTSADEVIEVYAYLKEYAESRGLRVVDSPTSYRVNFN